MAQADSLSDLQSLWNIKLPGASQLLLSRNGTATVFQTGQRRVHLLDASSQNCVGRQLQGLESPVSAAAILSNGLELVIGDAEGDLRLWDLERAAELQTAPGPALHSGATTTDKAVQHIACCSSAIAACSGRHVAIYSTSCQFQLALPAMERPVTALAWVGDAVLVLACKDEISTWFIADGVANPGATLVLDVLGQISHISVSPTGDFVAAMTEDLVHVWSLSIEPVGGKLMPIRTLEGPPESQPTWVGWHESGLHLLAAFGNELYAWDAYNPHATQPGHAVLCAGFDAGCFITAAASQPQGGTLLAAASDTGQVLVFDSSLFATAAPGSVVYAASWGRVSGGATHSTPFSGDAHLVWHGTDTLLVATEAGEVTCIHVAHHRKAPIQDREGLRSRDREPAGYGAASGAPSGSHGPARAPAAAVTSDEEVQEASEEVGDEVEAFDAINLARVALNDPAPGPGWGAAIGPRTGLGAPGSGVRSSLDDRRGTEASGLSELERDAWLASLSGDPRAAAAVRLTSASTAAATRQPAAGGSTSWLTGGWGGGEGGIWGTHGNAAAALQDEAVRINPSTIPEVAALLARQQAAGGSSDPATQAMAQAMLAAANSNMPMVYPGVPAMPQWPAMAYMTPANPMFTMAYPMAFQQAAAAAASHQGLVGSGGANPLLRSAIASAQGQQGGLGSLPHESLTHLRDRLWSGPSGSLTASPRDATGLPGMRSGTHPGHALGGSGQSSESGAAIHLGGLVTHTSAGHSQPGRGVLSASHISSGGSTAGRWDTSGTSGGSSRAPPLTDAAGMAAAAAAADAATSAQHAHPKGFTPPGTKSTPPGTKPLKKVPEEEVRNVFVGNLAQTVGDSALETVFGQFGSITHVQIVRDKESKKSKGYAFIQYASPVSAAMAMRHMNGMALEGPYQGRNIKVLPSFRPAAPSSGGGPSSSGTRSTAHPNDGLPSDV